MTILNEYFLNQACTGQRPAHTWFLEIALIRDVSMCVCVSTSKAINYIHVILNLFKQLNKFVMLINIMKQLCIGVTIVTKQVVSETNLIRLY